MCLTRLRLSKKRPPKMELGIRLCYCVSQRWLAGWLAGLMIVRLRAACKLRSLRLILRREEEADESRFRLGAERDIICPETRRTAD